MILTRIIQTFPIIRGSENAALSLRSRAIRTAPITSVTISTYPAIFSIAVLTPPHLARTSQIWALLNAALAVGSYEPARYFSKGIRDPKKNRPPIPYLLTETNEQLAAQWPPGSPSLLRSICKGKGTLQRTQEGLVYLQIDNHFMTALFPFLQKTYALAETPYFQPASDPQGAHIPVISDRESAFHYLDRIPEIGQNFSFVVEGLYAINPTFWEEAAQVWFFKIVSPELETLRRRHFLPDKMGGHSFHIALALKPKRVQSKQPHPIMRINVGFLAA